MALLDLLEHRKSVRDFLDRPVEREKIMMCLQAARIAPSASNSQPWKFIVLGTCWIGWFDEGAVKSILNVPEEKKIDVLIALGYYDRQNVSSEHDREPMDKIASFNSY